MSKAKRAKPVHTVRLGRIVAAIWQNETEGGSIRHNVTLSRLYKPEGEDWQDSTSFGRDDLLLLRKVVDLAHTWIYQQSQEQNGSAKEHNDAPQQETEQGF